MLSRRGRALPLAGRSLALCGRNPFEAITLSPGQAHHRITPVTQHTTTTTPTPMMPDSNRDRYMLDGGGDSRGKAVDAQAHVRHPSVCFTRADLSDYPLLYGFHPIMQWLSCDP